MTSGAEWRRRLRRVQTERAAAKRRHPATGRARPDQPGTLHAVPNQSDRQPSGPAAATTEETNVTDLPACRRGCPEGECYCTEPTWAEMNDLCTGCGGIGECYCGERG